LLSEVTNLPSSSMKVPKPAPPTIAVTTARALRDEAQQHPDRHRHAQAAPEHVSDVKAAAAEPRVPRGLQVDAQHHDRGRRADQKGVQ
jgi:hypothetical protein